jgi:uncharacterized protein YcbX
MNMTVAALWRYPVKTLAGEPIATAQLTRLGIPGDRVVHVRGPEGIRTSRRHHRLLGLHATLGGDGEPLINGLAWNSPGALDLVRLAAGADAWLQAGTGPDRFDVLPLLVATDGAVEQFGRDVRRLRPNILIGGVAGMAEVDWPGAQLTIGDAVIDLDSLRQRCPMTIVDPDTLERDRAVLLDINHRFGGKLALNAGVITPGTIHVGDEVSVSRPHRSAEAEAMV